MNLNDSRQGVIAAVNNDLVDSIDRSVTGFGMTCDFASSVTSAMDKMCPGGYPMAILSSELPKTDTAGVAPMRECAIDLMKDIRSSPVTRDMRIIVLNRGQGDAVKAETCNAFVDAGANAFLCEGELDDQVRLHRVLRAQMSFWNDAKGQRSQCWLMQELVPEGVKWTVLDNGKKAACVTVTNRQKRHNGFLNLIFKSQHKGDSFLIAHDDICSGLGWSEDDYFHYSETTGRPQPYKGCGKNLFYDKFFLENLGIDISPTAAGVMVRRVGTDGQKQR